MANLFGVGGTPSAALPPHSAAAEPQAAVHKTRVAILVGCALSLLILLASCNPKNSSEQISENGNSSQKVTRMLPNPITGPINYVALGDSTGAGVGATEGGYVARLFKLVETKRPGSTLLNLCVSGATTEDVLSDQLDRGMARQPGLVTLGIGINDIGHNVSWQQFSQNYEEILSKLTSNTRATIVVTNIPDISSAPRIPAEIRSEYHQLIVAFNQKLEEIALRHGATVFDVYTVTHEQLPSHPEFFSTDGFHPSDRGYQLWADRMWPTIARAIGAGAEAQP